MPACQCAHHPPSVRRKGRPSPATQTCIRQGGASPTHSPDTYMHTCLCPKRIHISTHISAPGGHTHTHISLPQEDTRVHVHVHMCSWAHACARTHPSLPPEVHTLFYTSSISAPKVSSHRHTLPQSVCSLYTHTQPFTDCASTEHTYTHTSFYCPGEHTYAHTHTPIHYPQVSIQAHPCTPLVSTQTHVHGHRGTCPWQVPRSS